MSFETVITAENLGKAYRIYKKPQDRLYQMLLGKWKCFYEEFWALKNVNLNIHRGETLGVIGRNGSGKSTFLQMVCGTLEPSSGSVRANGRIAALLELGAGFNPEFTGRENVFLSASVLGLSNELICERFDAIAEFAGLGDFLDQPVKFYSSGMFARLAFSVAAHVDADILIVDEILAVGDASFTQKCMRYIHQFKEKGTLLFVSHDTSSVTALCDRAVWLDAGEVRDVGPASDVCHNYLASLNREKDNSNAFKIGGSRKRPPESSQAVEDHRKELLKSSAYRNDIEIFNFDPTAPWFGNRGATITSVILKNSDGITPPVFDGGESLYLHVTVLAEKDLKKPIVGFFVKDKLGQQLFGDNTFLTYRDKSSFVRSGEYFTASFKFQMPYLPTGDYSVLVACAEGTQQDHIQHHWIDDALFFRVHSSHVQKGLIGIPMQSIELSIGEPHISKLAQS